MPYIATVIATVKVPLDSALPSGTLTMDEVEQIQRDAATNAEQAATQAVSAALAAWEHEVVVNQVELPEADVPALDIVEEPQP